MVLLRVETQGTEDAHYLDLGNVSMKADYSILEIQDITQRKSENTQAFTLPFTETNNDFFSHFYNVNATGDFDVNVKTNAIVSVDSIEVIEGYLQLLSVNTTTQTYEVVVYGVIANIVNQLSDNKLNELDLSAYNHVLNIDNVTDSWDGAITYTDASTGDEILYPIIDYGYGYDVNSLESSSTSNLNNPIVCENLKPTIKVKTVLKKILNNVGYTIINSTFLDSDFFANQYMTLTTDKESIDTAPEDAFRIGTSANQTFNAYSLQTIPFTDQSVSSGKPFYVGNGNLNSSGGYTPAADGFYRFKIDLNYTTINDGGIQYVGLGLYFDIGGVETKVAGDRRLSGTNRFVSYTTDLIYLEAGQLVTLKFLYGGVISTSTINILQSSTNFSTATSYELVEAPTSNIGTTIDFSSGNNIMPESTQIDFLKSILSRYNLIMQPNRVAPYTLDIEPIQDFLDVGASIDWTKKLDTSKPVVIKPTYEFQKDKIIFKDLESSDHFTEKYEKKFGHPYNYYSIEIDSAFKQKGSNLENFSIFSSFTNTKVDRTNFLIPRIYKNTDNEIERVSAKPKLFYYSGKKDVSNWYLWESLGSSSPSSFTQMPFCSSYSMGGDTIQDTDFDIRFKTDQPIGEKSYLVKTPSTDTFTRCWSEYLHNIFDKDARILIADFKLSAIDIARLKYNDKIFVKDTYYRLNKISNYAIGKDVTTRVELIKILNFVNTLSIAGCNLQPDIPDMFGEVTFTDPTTGTTSAGNKVCCESNNYTWYGYTSKCISKRGSRINTQPPTAERSRINQNSRLGIEDRDTKVKGRVTELSDSDNATDGQILSWNTTDGNTEWVDAPSSGGTPSTPLNSVQFNNNGAFGGDSGLTYNALTNTLSSGRYLGENIYQMYNETSGDMAMYLTPIDFFYTNSPTYNGNIQDNGGSMMWGSTSFSQMCNFQVPKGYAVTGVEMKGSTNYAFYIYQSSWSSSSSMYKASGTWNTALTLYSYQYLIGTAGNYFTIRFSASTYGVKFYGCKLILEEV